LHREAKKSAPGHPPHALRPQAVRVDRPSASAITIKAARGGLTNRKDQIMATIGTFTKSDTGYTGSVRTLTVNAKARFTAAEKAKDNAPDYRVFAGTAEIGAAWKKISENGGREYLSVKLDDPSFPAPIYASLVEVEGGEFSLIWSRRNGN
jgi:uncharacterized protein (DUF736 family)